MGILLKGVGTRHHLKWLVTEPKKKRKKQTKLNYILKHGTTPKLIKKK